MINKKPQVFLYSYTQHPIESIGLAVSAWTSDDFNESPSDFSDGEARQLTKKAQDAFHKTALEFVDTVWVIKNVSRAFQQQLTRTRLASYSIQSMRVVLKNGFASNGHYTMPPSLDEDGQKRFHDHMLTIERMYESEIKNGMPVEDARGLLPLHIHSDISLRINMAALYNMTSQRFCVNTQWEYRQVANQMKREIAEKMDPILSSRMDAPCVFRKKCPMADEYCGVPVWKYSEEERHDIFEKYVNWKKKDDKWKIKWLGDEKPSYIELKNLL